MEHSMTIEPQIDEWTRRGHQQFKNFTQFKVMIRGEEVLMRWEEWMQWQATRDPLNDDPEEAERVRANIEADMAMNQRGPGIAKRNVKKARPAKKAATVVPKTTDVYIEPEKKADQ